MDTRFCSQGGKIEVASSNGHRRTNSSPTHVASCSGGDVTVAKGRKTLGQASAAASASYGAPGLLVRVGELAWLSCARGSRGCAVSLPVSTEGLPQGVPLPLLPFLEGPLPPAPEAPGSAHAPPLATSCSFGCRSCTGGRPEALLMSPPRCSAAGSTSASAASSKSALRAPASATAQGQMAQQGSACTMMSF